MSNNHEHDNHEHDNHEDTEAFWLSIAAVCVIVFVTVVIAVWGKP